MKRIAITLIILTSHFSFSQILVKAVVKDALTKAPVMSASVGVKNSASGTITNDEGAFQLTISNTAVIVISSLGYKSASIPAADFKDETTVIYLDQSEETLEEVMVTKIPLWQMLKEVIAVSQARFNKPITLHTYYREFSKLNGKYEKFADGLLDYHITGNIKKTRSDVVVKQNRTAVVGLQGEDEDELGSLLNLQHAITSSYKFSAFDDLLIENEKYEDYDWQLKVKKDKDGQELYHITFEPKTEVEKALYKGTITYDPTTKLIYHVDFYMAPSHQRYVKERNFLLLRAAYLDYKYKAGYKMSGANYVLNYNSKFLKFKVWTKKESYVSESRSDLLVTNFEKETNNYTSKEVFKKHRLTEKPSHYTDKFWQRNNAIVLTDEEEKIINTLEDAGALPVK